MKNITKYILILMCLSLFSCDKFLAESSQDLMVPKSVKDYKEFLYGEGLDNKTVLNDYLELMSDDADEFIPGGFLSNDTRELMWSYYTWQADPEVGLNNSFTPDNSWGEYYHKILISNVILAALDGMEGSEEEKLDLSGEAHFLRAYAYFMLVNLYGEPYESESQAETAMGVPLNDAVGVVDVKRPRASVAEVYARIESDIVTAIEKFKASSVKKTIFRPNLSAANLLASRVFLFQKKYDEAIGYANEVISAEDNALWNLSEAKEKSENFFCNINPEILFTYGFNNFSTYFKTSTMYKGLYVISKSLLDSYDAENDLRKEYYYLPNSKGTAYEPNKWYRSGYTVYAYTFRVAEAYLNRAEAYACTSKAAQAVDDLNSLRKNRYVAEAAYELSAASADEALTLVKEERRRELAFESARWFDLRCWGCPELVHNYTNTADGSVAVYKLAAGSTSYTLPIPLAEIEKNPDIKQINRAESTPVVSQGE